MVMSDNFNKFCGVLILLLLGLSTLFTLRASAEEYTPPAEDSTQTVTDSEETHEVVQVQGVQTYDPTLYEKLDTMQESLNTLIDIMTPAETGTEDAQSGELVQDYTAQLETISGQLVDLRTAAEMATAETAQPAAFEKPFADYSVSEVLLLVLAVSAGAASSQNVGVKFWKERSDKESMANSGIDPDRTATLTRQANGTYTLTLPVMQVSKLGVTGYLSGLTIGDVTYDGTLTGDFNKATAVLTIKNLPASVLTGSDVNKSVLVTCNIQMDLQVLGEINTSARMCIWNQK